MTIESIIVALQVFAIGVIISMCVAAMIKGIFIGIRLREKLQLKLRPAWKASSHSATKVVSQ
ncbi:hypothetical protein [Desulfoscipio gibsoniae]|uniref:Uncharacterized protein n=1 Tax=Desulfoscipio gibsoniae DSM 7213 TaxID=767817 RepID=R4KBA2_9FIRM|nr:hypothetical protein [Desulfoscipio gibsoniae]AGL00453.1 hypothetical protein Desgi_0905 [Desulfoscipio gibsoniae DSM 7213]